MLLRFVKLEWKSAIRSPMWQKNLILNIVIGFFLLLFAFYLLVLGIFMDELLEDIRPGCDKFYIFNGILLYYFLFDLLVRFLMQPMPKMNVESFLHLPVAKHKIIHFMIGRTITNMFNFIPLFIIIPVTFTIVVPYTGGASAARWLIAAVFLILANNFLAVFLKRMLGSRPMIVAATALILIGFYFLDKTGILSISVLSSALFQLFTNSSLLAILPLIWMIIAYWLQYRYLTVHLYPDEVQVRKQTEYGPGTGSRYLRSLGLTGSVLSLEYKLYVRNKRTRTMIYFLPVFLLYGFLFYTNDIYMKQNGWLMFVGVFMTGGMMMNYTNYAFGYESGYFDALLTKNIDFVHYIRIKYYISVLIVVLCYIATIPYVFYGMNILMINTAMFLYNIGILPFILLYFATYNKRRIDLSRGGAFNYQGIGASNWLAMLPAFLLPVIVSVPFNLAGYPDGGVIFTGILGLAGIFFSGVFIRIITRNFYRRKYIMAQCFREK